MRNGFGRIDRDIQKRVAAVRREQGEEAANKLEAELYKSATGDLKKIFAGAAAGAAAGSVIPGIGTVAGAMIGMWAGGAKAIYDHFKKS